MRKIVTIIILTLTLTSIGQNTSIDRIDNKVNQINSDTSLTMTQFDLNKVYDLTNNGSGIFKIWKSPSEIKKITQLSYHSYGKTETTVYLENGQPILIIENENHFNLKTTSSEPEYEKEMETVYQDRIYCINWELDPIHVETIGQRILTEGICGLNDYSGILDKGMELTKE